jgi:hypothetical protein
LSGQEFQKPLGSHDLGMGGSKKWRLEPVVLARRPETAIWYVSPTSAVG